MKNSGSPNLSDLLVKSITDLLLAQTSEERVQAARALGETRSKTAISYLIKALADEAAEVRLAAVNSLAEIGGLASIDALKTLLDTETDPAVSRSVILNAISRIESAAARQSRPAETVTASKLIEPVYREIQRTVAYSPPTSMPATDASAFRGAEDRSRLSNSVFHESAQFDEAREKQLGLGEAYRRAAEERELLEKARRQAHEDASRRAEEVLRSLQSDEESLVHLEQSLTARRAQLERGHQIATAEAARLDELERRLAIDENNRQQLEAERLRLQAESRARAEAERSELERLRFETAEQQQRVKEYELSLERLGKLRTTSEAYYREQSGLLTAELNSLRQAGEEVTRLVAGAEAARQRAEEEIARLEETHKRIEVEEDARRAADHERLALELETKVRADEARRRLEEARNRDIEGRRQIEKEARRSELEGTYRLGRLNALRKQREEEAQQRVMEEEKLRASIDAIREATQERLKAIEEAELLKQTEMATFQQAQEQAQSRLAEAMRRRDEEDARLKAEYEFCLQVEDEAHRRVEEKRQLISEARQRAEAAHRRLEELDEEVRLQAIQDEMLANEARQRAEDQAKRIERLEAERKQAEAETLELIAKEQEILAGIETFRKTAADVRKKLAEHEAERVNGYRESLVMELDEMTSAESLRL